MPLRHIDGASLDYYLVLFDSNGAELPEADGRLLSATLAGAVPDGVTDVFFASHGWKGDVPAAISQYDRWVAAMAGQARDSERARALAPGFKPLVVGVHWPSLPWGDESSGAGLLSDGDADEFAAEQELGTAELVQLYSERVADTDAARTALTAILAAAGDSQTEARLAAGELPAGLEHAYKTLFAEAGLGLDGAAAAPGSDQQTFTPALTISEWTSAAPGGAAPPGQPGLLSSGLTRGVKDALLMPVRQLSFWSMKRRARLVGETGVHSLLADLQQSAPQARFHLMGHSFGCIVVSAAISGPLGQRAISSRLPRPVDSLFLVQGALSLWSFAERIPYPPNAPGYFRPIDLPPALVNGPIVTTRSTFDHAVGTFYPLAARAGSELLLGEELPEFGGVGAFGIQGTPAGATHDLPVLNADAEYGFEAAHTYNIDASPVICHGAWPSGAHSDIAHAQIAHVFWQAALPAMARS
jgi:hypothetical protein